LGGCHGCPPQRCKEGAKIVGSSLRHGTRVGWPTLGVTEWFGLRLRLVVQARLTLGLLNHLWLGL
jgi:hypothetical protein